MRSTLRHTPKEAEEVGHKALCLLLQERYRVDGRELYSCLLSDRRRPRLREPHCNSHGRLPDFIPCQEIHSFDKTERVEHVVDHQGSGNLTCIEGLETSLASETNGSKEAEGIQMA